MSGKYITKQQAELYMKYRKIQELTQETSAAKAGISVRSGRKIENGTHTTCKPSKPRAYKTRQSPIDRIWEIELEPMLLAHPDLQAKTLFLYLQRTYKNEQGEPLYTESIERTLQRKVANWRAIHGSPKEVMFPQDHLPGVQGLSDFSHLDEVEITIEGIKFQHMLYHFRLVYSKWSYVKIIRSGESMQALSEGLQEALFALGGAPREHRTDSLSAAYKNLSSEVKQDITERYHQLCAHYNMIPTRNNKGKKHENGSVESSHRHIKNRIKQELILRGSNDFASIGEYESWVHNIVKLSNLRNAKNIEIEQLSLQDLPFQKTVDYEIKSTRVSNLSIITVKSLTYSVPSHLSGHTITLHIYQGVIQIYLGSHFILNLPRKYIQTHLSKYSINYKHVIHSLIKKPRAFRHCKYRDDLLPSTIYKEIWCYLNKHESFDVAPKIMLRLLKLAADFNCEKQLEDHLIKLIKNRSSINIEDIENKFNSINTSLPVIHCKQHSIKEYDFIIHKNIGE